MADSWFRFYNTALEHPKVMMLSDLHFRAWVKLLCLASKMSVIPDDMALIGRTLGRAKQQAADIVQVLLSAVLLDRVEGGYIPHNWKTKQYKSDCSTERVKRFRGKDGNVSETDHRQRQSTETERKKKAAPLGRFQEFWLVCPKKTGQGAAEKAWLKAIKSTEEQTLIDAMRNYAASVSGQDKTFLKTPGPWLNGKHWLDEGIAPAEAIDPAVAEEAKDKADRYFKRGKYAPNYQ